jgi:chromosome partitioning protein
MLDRRFTSRQGSQLGMPGGGKWYRSSTCPRQRRHTGLKILPSGPGLPQISRRMIDAPCDVICFDAFDRLRFKGSSHNFEPVNMFAISLIGQKGGVGKTTIALGLAVAAARAGHATAIVDLDPQASAAKWSDRREQENPAVVRAQAGRLRQTMDTARSEGVNFVFIDTAGRKDDSALNAARISDLVLIPTRPNILELETLPEVADLMRLAGSPPAFVLLNCVHPSAGPRGISDTQQTIKELFGLAVCPVHVCQRSAHAEAPTSGQSPQELDEDGKAADELDRLFDFACELVNTGKDAQIRNILARREESLDRLFDFTRELVNTGRTHS